MHGAFFLFCSSRRVHDASASLGASCTLKSSRVFFVHNPNTTSSPLHLLHPPLQYLLLLLSNCPSAQHSQCPPKLPPPRRSVPSPLPGIKRVIHCTYVLDANNAFLQAASAIADFNMNDSPAKKLDFAGNNDWTDDTIARPIKGIPDLPEESDDVKHPSTAPTIRKEEAHEPLLQENPHRFVLFPIKYHEVRVFSDAFPRVTRKVLAASNNTIDLADVQEG